MSQLLTEPVQSRTWGAERLPVPCREKKLLVSSEDYGRDLTGVQNLRKKHKRLEAELAAHEPAIQVRGRRRPGRPFALTHSAVCGVCGPRSPPGREDSWV